MNELAFMKIYEGVTGTWNNIEIFTNYAIKVGPMYIFIARFNLTYMSFADNTGNICHIDLSVLNNRIPIRLLKDEYKSGGFWYSINSIYGNYVNGFDLSQILKISIYDKTVRFPEIDLTMSDDFFLELDTELGMTMIFIAIKK